MLKRIPKQHLNTIFEGDCLTLLRALPDESVDLAVTSPPYNIGKGKERRRSLDHYLHDQRAVLTECKRILKPTGSVFWQVGSYTNAGVHVPLDVKIFQILEDLDLIPRNRIVWIRQHGLHGKRRFSGRYETVVWFTKGAEYKFFLDPIRVPQKYPEKKEWEKGKNHGTLTSDPMGKNPGDVWAFRNVKHNHEEQTIHPAQFPEDLVERILLATTEEGDIVLDPYMGSGTTAIVAKRYGRAFVGAEIESDYVALATRRLSGEPDGKGQFPNLKTLRDHAERNGIQDLRHLRFDRQVGRVPTPRDRARIQAEQQHLDLFIGGLEWEADQPAIKRFGEPADSED